MPRKKPEELKSQPKVASQPANPDPAPAAAPAPATPSIEYNIPAGAKASTGGYHPADTNGDGVVDDQERQMYLEFKRKELEDADAMRDAQRNMTWFALFGLLLYPFAVVGSSYFGLEQASGVLGSMAPTYFVAVAGIVAAFFGAQAYSGKAK